jgi:acetoin utilization deacetylase AcuC-like enzyme
MIGLAYHKDYNKYDLGLQHPLIGEKPKRTVEFLKDKVLLEEIDIFKPERATEEDLLLVHDPKFIQRVKELSIKGGMLSSDTPAPKGIYDIALVPTGGTILAGLKLFEGYKITANPLAGFHHASRTFASGFCFFNDIAIIIEKIRKKYKLKKFLIIDLDLHHANGTQEIYFRDSTVLNLSFHQDGRTLYPGTGAIDKIGRDEGEGYTVNLPLMPYTGDKSYIYAFENIIPRITEKFNPEIIIYQCGVDTHHSDPLGDLFLTHQTYYYLAKRMKELSEKTCNKLLVLFGGGYNSDASVISYYNIMCGLLNKNNFISEKEISNENYELTVELVKKLKSILKPYWNL